MAENENRREILSGLAILLLLALGIYASYLSVSLVFAYGVEFNSLSAAIFAIAAAMAFGTLVVTFKRW